MQPAEESSNTTAKKVRREKTKDNNRKTRSPHREQQHTRTRTDCDDGSPDHRARSRKRTSTRKETSSNRNSTSTHSSRSHHRHTSTREKTPDRKERTREWTLTITKNSEAGHTSHPTEDTNTGTQDQDHQPGINIVGQRWLQTHTKSDIPAEDPHHGEDELPPLEDELPPLEALPPVEAWTVVNQGDTTHTHHQGGKTEADPTAPTGSLGDTNTGTGPTKTQS